MDGLLEEEWTLGSTFWSGSNIARADGVGILMTNPYIRPKASRDVESGRILVLDLEIQGSPLRVINVYGPTNVAENVGGSTPQTPTWVSSSGASYSRIDMFLLSPRLRLRSLTSEAAHFSDHRMVTVTLDWEGLVKIGRGSWRMNTSVSEDQTVRLSFSRRYLEWRTLKELYDPPLECLLQLEGFEVARELSETKEHLATLYREKQKKSQYRSKLQGLEEDEKCTRYFFRKARSRQKPILSLYNSQGDSVKNSADILGAAGDFYGRLYDTNPADGDLATAFLEGLNRVIEGGEIEDPKMSIEELTRAVHSINKQKAPGPDGIPGEFYQTIWDLIKNDVAEVFQAIYRERRLGESMRQSTITLIPKKGDLKDLRNWRPINLLPVDNRIMTKALTKRFQSHLPTVIAAATGALINLGKSELFLSGHWHETLTTSFPVKTETIKLLGITFQRGGEGSTSWAETICHVQRKICEWSAQSLTMTGKTLILKAIFLPILLYLGRVFPPDKAASKKIERLMFTFVWGSQMEQLQHSTLYKMAENGGKGVPDILNIIRAQQLSNLVKTFNKPDRKASFFERHYATPILRTLGMGTIDHTVPYSWDPPKVYKPSETLPSGRVCLQLGLRLGNTKTSWATSAPRTQWPL
ncbi:hypothetical protein DPEC_G00157090 [Dallia pectoralis]|uniref:Uncharacterized protein n=1 Tax=Dallia pectoralis TaxID=75939 RepID=A0ACC2GL35_DALPE|nr:hypothetical protein DPEC_G00157090 [Dallia pectoralis]